jgi:glycosyltransferase involved in cell wall biosynthesis
VTVLLDARVSRRPSGIANYAFALAREFGRLAPREVTPLCYRRHAPVVRRFGLEPWIAGAGPLDPGRLPDASVVHGPNYRAPDHSGAARVVTIHDVGFLTLPECHPPGMPERLDALIRETLDDVDAFLCDSRSTRDEFLSRYDVAPERCAVVPLGVDAARFRGAQGRRRPTVLRVRYGLRRPYVLFVGAMVPRKDLVTLLEAFARIRPVHPDLELVIAGHKTKRWASDWPRVKRWLGEHRRHASRVRILNFVPSRDLPGLYAHCAVVALTSLLEGFGLTVLEGLACGRPVVATRVGAVPEVGEDAVYYGEARDPDSIADALLAALRGDDREQRRRRGAEIVARHSWRRTAEQTLDVYRAVAGHRPPVKVA